MLSIEPVAEPQLTLSASQLSYGLPPAPHLEAPADGTSGHASTVVLMWVPVTGAAYHVQVAEHEPDFTMPFAEASGLEEVFYVVSGLLEGRWYHWRVRACVEDNCSAWSSVWRWRVGEQGPASSGTVRRYYYVRDHLGSVRATVDEAGVVVHHDDYYPFGARMPHRSMETPEAPRERYSGKELDKESELLYYGARYYDPVIGRWSVVDPLADDYHGVSPFAYVLNNPVNLVDPTGEYPTCGEESDCDDVYQEGAVVSNRFGEFKYLGGNRWAVVQFGRASLRGVNMSAEQLGQRAFLREDRTRSEGEVAMSTLALGIPTTLIQAAVTEPAMKHLMLM